MKKSIYLVKTPLKKSIYLENFLSFYYDFMKSIVLYKSNITLIEVKSRNGNTKSAKTVLNDNIKYPNANHLIKLCESNISVNDNTLVIPYYLTYLIK